MFILIFENMYEITHCLNQFTFILQDKLLKGCGTLFETPAEILKVSEEVKDSTRQGGDSKSSKFHSIQMLSLDNQPEQPPTPTKLTEEGVNTSGSLSCTPCRYSFKHAGFIIFKYYCQSNVQH